MSNKTLFMPAIGLSVLVVGLSIGLVLVKQPQLLKKQAAGLSGTASFKLTPSSANLAPGDILTVSGQLNTGNVPVLGYQVIVNFSYSGASAPADLLGTSATVTESAFNCLANRITQDASAQKYTLTLGCLTPISNPLTIYNTNGNDNTVFTFDLKGVYSGNLSFTFDQGNSYVTQASDGQDILANPSGGSYTVTSGGRSTPTPTDGIGGDGGPTPTPIAGPTNACGGTCGSDSNCSSGLTCYSGYCRNPSCVTATNCSCPNTTYPTLTPTPTPSTKPKISRPTPTPSLKPIIQTSPTPTGTPTNPFLGGPRTYPKVSIPPLVEEELVPPPKPNLIIRVIDFFVQLFQSIF